MEEDCKSIISNKLKLSKINKGKTLDISIDKWYDAELMQKVKSEKRISEIV